MNNIEPLPLEDPDDVARFHFEQLVQATMDLMTAPDVELRARAYKAVLDQAQAVATWDITRLGSIRETITNVKYEARIEAERRLLNN